MPQQSDHASESDVRSRNKHAHHAQRPTEAKFRKYQQSNDEPWSSAVLLRGPKHSSRGKRYGFSNTEHVPVQPARADPELPRPVSCPNTEQNGSIQNSVYESLERAAGTDRNTGGGFHIDDDAIFDFSKMKDILDNIARNREKNDRRLSLSNEILCLYHDRKKKQQNLSGIRVERMRCGFVKVTENDLVEKFLRICTTHPREVLNFLNSFSL
jgi:hypothetical protein